MQLNNLKPHIHPEILKSLLSINNIFRLCEHLKSKKLPANFITLFLSVSFLNFVPLILCNSILNTFKPDIFILINIILGISANIFLNFQSVNFMSKVMYSYSKATSIADLMESTVPIDKIILYEVFYEVCKKFVLKIILETGEERFISIRDLLKLNLVVFLVYAGRLFDIPKVIILAVGGVLFLSFEFYFDFRVNVSNTSGTRAIELHVSSSVDAELPTVTVNEHGEFDSTPKKTKGANKKMSNKKTKKLEPEEEVEPSEGPTYKESVDFKTTPKRGRGRPSIKEKEAISQSDHFPQVFVESSEAESQKQTQKKGRGRRTHK
ncbi:hypothetical protein CDIK_0559 [Cucumispora dikerogammari]|nr:hypothetical protein CDIK_0559 [Cucumispora dikerogammari]